MRKVYFSNLSTTTLFHHYILSILLLLSIIQTLWWCVGDEVVQLFINLHKSSNFNNFNQKSKSTQRKEEEELLTKVERAIDSQQGHIIALAVQLQAYQNTMGEVSETSAQASITNGKWSWFNWKITKYNWRITSWIRWRKKEKKV